jgi:hypothetical protein
MMTSLQLSRLKGSMINPRKTADQCGDYDSKLIMPIASMATATVSRAATK